MSFRAGPPLGGFVEPVPTTPGEALSLIDHHSSVEGTFSTNRDLRIEGQMRGTLRCQGLLYIAEGADVDAAVEASSITVAGQLRGNILCRGRFQILPTGRVTATLTTESLVIDEGAVYEGELRMEAGLSQSAEGTPESEAAEPSVLRRFGPEQGEEPPITNPNFPSRGNAE